MYNVTKEDILYYFDYDRDAGELVWKNPKQDNLLRRVAGQVTKGSTNYTHHKVIQCSELFGKKNVRLHRIIYFLEKGEWLNKIDHIDGNGLNNHISNLRDGKGVNNRNTVRRKPKKRSEGLPKGVFRTQFSKRKGLYYYKSTGTYDGNIEVLYYGFDQLEAICARKSWENKMLEAGYFTGRHFGRI